MLSKARLLTLISVVFYQFVVGQENQPRPAAGTAYVVPFQLTAYNNLSVRAVLNGRDSVDLMFHTAANAVTLTETAVGKLKTLHFDDSTEGIKSWGGEQSARLSSRNALQIGALTWENVPIWENTNSGQGTEGKFGIDLFENKVIEIDFERRVLVIDSSLPDESDGYEKLKLTIDGDYLFLTGICTIGEKKVAHKFLIHSGYGGAVLFDDEFVRANHIGEHLEIVGEQTLKDSYGNTLITKKAVLPALGIGRETLQDVPVGFFEGAIGRQKMSVIGGDVLKRFTLIIDARREYVYLKPNGLARSGYTPV
ncbi:aspartyl protease family protein [Parapedobacter koreensis]|uniref:Aspartyl protease n=1 Tax=Parapedobacter koreensis TaxID=332977 RepID=A0A1H7QBC6_9SPHI|nr:aspartyl protease family protein [Parapedobacter koreensis]SEL45273.1 Aspartyl protease [Parapedobacter koreensis]